jgi:hypothetical protein
MKIQSRKLIGMIIGIVVLTAVIVFIAFKVPSAISPAVIILYFVSIVFLITAYIGGNVFSTWVKSKYFRAELQGD